MGAGAIAGSENASEVVDETVAIDQCCGRERSKSDCTEFGSPAPKAIRPCLTEEESSQRRASFERLSAAYAEHQEESKNRMTDLKRLAKLCESLPARLDEAPAKDLRDSSCVIFDWDDTLFPTWYVENVVKPTSLGEPLHMAPCFREPMKVHAAAVKQLLQTARKFARVAIVTLAAAPWVHVTSKQYWQDFDFEELCSELQIPIYYSRTFIKKAEKRQDEGVDLFEAAKRKAMTKCLRTLQKKTGIMPSNNISIGDSRREHQALKDIMWEHCGYSFCKTVLFTEEPPIESLTDEVRIMNLAIGRLVATQSDLELSTESAADLSSILSFAADTNAVQAVPSVDPSAETLSPQKETAPERDPKAMRALIKQYVKRGKPKHAQITVPEVGS